MIMKLTTRLTLEKYQSHVIIGGVIAVLLAGVVWSARPQGTAENSEGAASGNGALFAEERAYDFGVISMTAGKVQHNFSVRNAGTDPLTVKKLYTSCMCTTASLIKDGQTYGPFGMPMHGPIPEINQTLVPGQTVPIEVTFDPAAHGPAGVGRISRVVYLENNAGKPLELKFSAMVTP